MVVEVSGRQQRPIDSLLIKWYGSNISNKIAGILAKSTLILSLRKSYFGEHFSRRPNPDSPLQIPHAYAWLY